MKYPEYTYVDVAVNGAGNRNRLCDLTKLGDPTGHRDAYMTYFRYPEEMTVYFQNNKRQNKRGYWYPSVMGYKGSAYTDWIPIDIDAPTLEEAQDHAIRLLHRLEMYSIDTNACRYYFSGSKGFHILIPSDIAGLEPSEDIHLRLKYLVKQLAGDIPIDTTLYDKVRLFRLPNTINTKSGLYKVELYEFELRNMGPRQICEMAHNPREELDIEEEYDRSEFFQECLQTFEEQQHQPNTGAPTANGQTEGPKAKLCMWKIMQGVAEGGRDNAGLRVVTHLKHTGLNPQMIWMALSAWNEANKPPMDLESLERLYRQGLERPYDFGCRDEVLQQYCDKRCRLWKEEYGMNNVSRRMSS